jgi:hypothetical protein
VLPQDLTPTQFTRYPPEARKLVVDHLETVRQLPLAFLPLLLREAMAYDWRFPIERRDLDHQFAYLGAMSRDRLAACMQPFTTLRVSSDLEQVDWVNNPAGFSERLSAHLWATHQIEAFRTASVEYVHKLNASKPAETLPIPRLGIVIVGAGVADNKLPLFRKLRPYGTHFKNVRAENSRAVLLEAVATRAAKHPEKFAHWYIDGDKAESAPASPVACVSYSSLNPLRLALVARMRQVMQNGGGPEALRSLLAQMKPEDLGMDGTGDAAVLNRLQISLLTEGSGTQLFSTTFVQWTAREVLRRAQPLTVLVRFTPRQREDSMRELIAGGRSTPVPDPEGSLIDGDMGAYYTWINLQRLAEADKSSFLAWFENHGEALAVGPGFQRGQMSAESVSMAELIARLT